VSDSAACVTPTVRDNSIDRAGVLERFEVMLSDSQKFVKDTLSAFSETFCGRVELWRDTVKENGNATA
jgi:hypothetical protein